MGKLLNNKTLMNAVSNIAYTQGQDRFTAEQMKFWLMQIGKKKISMCVGRTNAVSWVLKFHPNIDVHIMGKSKIRMYSYKDNTESKAKAGE
jgi:hypothetical protein